MLFVITKKLLKNDQKVASKNKIQKFFVEVDMKSDGAF